MMEKKNVIFALALVGALMGGALVVSAATGNLTGTSNASGEADERARDRGGDDDDDDDCHEGRHGGKDDDDDDDDRVIAMLNATESFTVVANATEPVTEADAEFEVRNAGNDTAVVTLVLTGPDGATLATQTVEVPAGEEADVEIEHVFAEGAEGATGAYTATLTVDSGSVTVHEAEVEAESERWSRDGGR